jgi:3-hydroxyisobutyrate dehydrogenase-like beta-hydroxyacid dehydrogenase
MQIAVLGIGLMGFPMARRLCEAGHAVHAWNRSREKAERLAPFGATVHASAADAVKDAEAVVCMLESGPVIEDVLFRQRAAEAMRDGTLFIDMASIQPREARDHAARLSERGLQQLDAPVSGGTVARRTARWRSWWVARRRTSSAPSRSSRCWAAPPTWARTALANSPSWPTR